MTKSKKSTPTPNRVISIDPGFDRCGVAIIEGDKLLYSACIVTDRKQPHEERLSAIGAEIAKVTKKWRPTALAMEKLFFNQNVNTALKVAEARGVVLYEVAKTGIPVYEYSPQDVKIAVTGYGKATKPQVESMALRLLGLKKAPRHDDETDAMAVGITHLASSRHL